MNHLRFAPEVCNYGKRTEHLKMLTCHWSTTVRGGNCSFSAHSIGRLHMNCGWTCRAPVLITSRNQRLQYGLANAYEGSQRCGSRVYHLPYEERVISARCQPETIDTASLNRLSNVTQVAARKLAQAPQASQAVLPSFICIATSRLALARRQVLLTRPCSHERLDKP